MYLELGLDVVPPSVTLHEPDDFTEFKVVVASSDHAYVPPDALRRLAGSRGADASWQAGFEKMVAYARDHGWVGADGAIRAHVEWAPPGAPIGSA